MEFSLLTKGLILGFSIAAPVGPIGVLCIRRSLSSGWWSGFLTGLGAATADAFYGCVAGFGLTIITDLLTGQKQIISLAGGIFLLFMGIRILFSKPKVTGNQPKQNNLITAFLTSLFLTLSNPMTIISFAAVFAGMGLVDAGEGTRAAIFLVTGVFTGSALWWIILSTSAWMVQSKINTKAIAWINRFSGITLFSLGAMAVSGWL